MSKAIFVFLFAVLSNFNAWSSPDAQLIPIDQAKDNPSFVKFKKELLSAIEKRDGAFIKKIISEDVMYDFGSMKENRIEGFIEKYKLQDKKSSFWEDLREAISLGCTAERDTFTCPYVYSKWPDEYDSMDYLAVIEKDAKIYSQPKNSSSVIKVTNYDLLKTVFKGETDWYEIDLGKGKRGYLKAPEGRHSFDYRVRFVSGSSGWKIVWFIAGD